ncbi:MAG: NADP-dependent isocitrate dehydrogenase [Clostridia bacterium]|nr:NADP-dependent isocitrate dehydrogenase [Clostridia bacterium]
MKDEKTLEKRYAEALGRLEKHGQTGLLACYASLSNEGRDRLLKDVEEIDLDLMDELFKKAGKHEAGGEVDPRELTPLAPIDSTKLSRDERARLTKLGLEAIKAGKLAVLTMAGGQGTRLGHNGPKGTFDIGLPSHKSLFELHTDKLRRVSEQAGSYVPWYIMTSEINHEATVAFFEEHGYFGYPKDKVRFFPQTMIPPLTPDGKLRLEAPDKVLRSPNGNGGMFVSLKKQGCLDELRAMHIEYLMVTGVDNCLVKMADPLFLGALIDGGECEAIAKSYLKRGPGEKSGVFCYRGGKPGVVEYTEIPKECAEMTGADGQYVYGDCNLLSYIFRMDAAAKLCDAGMDYHVAVKKLKYFDPDTGSETETAGGYKFELFLFDAFRELGSLRVLRVERTEEFAPVKNPTGEDSVELARQMFMDVYGKIQMKTPLVEMDGDEMTRIIWKKIKETVLEPFIDLKTEYYDLSIQNRDATDDQVTVESALATKKYGVAVKCATITANPQRQQEFGLKKLWKSPNATIRAILDGTVFRAPILVKGVMPLVPGWKKPIVIARHAYGDIYAAVDATVPEGGKAELVITDPDGSERRITVKDFAKGSGIVMGMHNTDASVANFARACFQYALDLGVDLWFSAKDTILKVYDVNFRKIFADIYENEYKARFEEKGIAYFYTLVDDAIARVMKSEGGFLWSCKNYDGDVFSDMLATAFGSLAMMTSVLVSPDGYYEFEAAHGTIPRHYHKYLRGEPTSTNPVATLFAWTGALSKRGELDGIPELVDFARKVEESTLEAIAEGNMTGDLALISTLEHKKVMNLDEFLQEIAGRVAEKRRRT